ncbi:MAG: aspartate--tRNA ligase [Fibrobacterota bacterium]
MESIRGLKRTHHCKELTGADTGSEVTLMGWVDRRRDHGGVIFIDLRDKNGRTQVVFRPEHNSEAHKKADSLRNEYVIAIQGKVEKRLSGMENPKLYTGEIEILADTLRILNTSDTPPIQINEQSGENEDIRLKYRFLDLRRPWVQENIIFRDTVTRSIRKTLAEEGFHDIETPILMKSTPEGARDFLVPSRLNRGSFYALPQSPQIYKQLLMVSGFERYYQIAKCFRDEDLRSDRQPEFTQVDLEMSFVETEDVMNTVDRLLAKLFKDTLEINIPSPIPRLTYKEAMSKYGSDKPDLRFGMELQDKGDFFKDCDFKVFRNVLDGGGIIKGIRAEGCGDFSRKVIDELTAFVGTFGSKGLVWMRVQEEGIECQLTKFFREGLLEEVGASMGAKPGDMLFFVAADSATVNRALGELRLEIARRKNLLDPSVFNFTWVVDFPLFEYDDNEKRWAPLHHPFTCPDDRGLELLDTDDYYKAGSKAYDIVLNGVEIGGGSIRVHDPVIQRKIFRLLKISDEEAEQKFGFLVDALKYGAPPHGGLALGLDRLAMLMKGCESIREVIPFPKTSTGASLIDNSPSPVSDSQLRELSIKLRETQKDG